MLGLSGQSLCRLHYRAMRKRQNPLLCTFPLKHEESWQVLKKHKEFESLKRKEIFRHSHFKLSSLIIWMRSARDTE